jgi:hypothetical protein
MTRVRFIASLALLFATSVACSSKQAAGPSSGSYTITFPSTAAAVAAESVQVLVFDASDAGTDQVCPELVLARRSNQALPTTIAEAKPVSPCSMQGGAGQITISYGARAVLAVAQMGGADFLIGCAVQNVGEGSTQVPVQLALASTTVTVPVTQCASLTDHCAHKCQ